MNELQALSILIQVANLPEVKARCSYDELINIKLALDVAINRVQLLTDEVNKEKETSKEIEEIK